MQNEPERSAAEPEPPAAASSAHGADLVERAYSAVRERILDGDLAPGQPLPQTRLAEGLGVSRTPLREALRLLAMEGLVELRPNRGAIVADLTATDMSAAWQARLILEPGAARLAALSGDAEALRRMRRAIDEQRSSSHDPRAAYEANRDFHVALVEASGNPYLSQLAHALWVRRVGATIYGAQRISRHRALAFAAEHEAIADAVEAGDAESAGVLVLEHIRAAPPLPFDPTAPLPGGPHGSSDI